MPGAEDYTQRASECLRLFEEAPGANDAHMLLRMAEAWLRLADFASKRDALIEAVTDDAAQ